MTIEDRKWCVAQEERRRKVIAESKEIDGIFKVLVFNMTSRYETINPLTIN